MKITKKQAAELQEYNQYRTSIGLGRLSSFVAPRISKSDFRPLKVETVSRRQGSLQYQTISSVKDTCHVASVRSIMDPRALANESPETRREIISKSKRIAPAYSKGAYQLITEGMDVSDLGRKK